MNLKNAMKIYFMKGDKKKLMGHLTKIGGKMAIAYVKEGEIISYMYLSDLNEEIIKFRRSLQREKSSLTR